MTLRVWYGLGDPPSVCEASRPKPKGAEGRWAHEGASEVADSQRDGWPCGDTVTIKCPHCGEEWTEELPQ